MRFKSLAAALMLAGTASMLGGCSSTMSNRMSKTYDQLPDHRNVVVMSGNGGDPFSPTMTSVFVQNRKTGEYEHIATGSGQAPGTAIVSAVAGGLANGVGYGVATNLVGGVASSAGSAAGGASAGNINIKVRASGGGAKNSTIVH